jgi:hypothetical protein
MDGDGDFDFDDIDGFVEALQGGGPESVPEPSAWLLAGLGLLALVGYRWRKRG